MARLIAERPGLRVPGTWDGLELAIRAVLGQQIMVGAAIKLAGKLVAQYGEPLSAPLSGLTHVFPHAAVLACLNLSGVCLGHAPRHDESRACRTLKSGRLQRAIFYVTVIRGRWSQGQCVADFQVIRTQTGGLELLDLPGQERLLHRGCAVQ